MTHPEREEDQIIFNFISSDPIFNNSEKVIDWIISVCKEEGYKVGQINYIFCDDEYLLKINQQYLSHDEFTDIITFPYSEDPIESDIYISLDRIEENAKDFEVSFHDELHRVMVHGILHLCGYGDKTKEEKKKMREKEDYYVNSLIR